MDQTQIFLNLYKKNKMVLIHTESELDKLREAGRIVALVHKEVKELIKEGITTLELDELAKTVIKRDL